MKTVLICHEGDAFDQQGLTRWLSSFSDLAGMVVLRERSDQVKRRIKCEIERSGWIRFSDILAFRLYYKLFLDGQYRDWIAATIASLQQRYGDVPQIPAVYTHTPNSPEAEAFIRGCKPDVTLARCKFILKERIFSIPTVGTFVMHPGICPEYRNAHGCFWALARRDMSKVGMTLFRVDSGVDTGPVYGYFSYDFDEKRESHTVIQQRCVSENLDAIAAKLKEVAEGKAQIVLVSGRESGTWGQPWMSQYLQWRLAARRR
jgi:hypothetical protein